MSAHPQQEAAALKRHGVRHLFGVAGSGTSYEVVDACEHVGIPFVLTAHEGAAVMMAGAAAFVTGGLGAAVSIKGPGVANLASGLALARFEQQPVVSIAESYAPDAPAGQQHKRMPQDALMGAVTKTLSYRSATAASIDALIASALAEVPGPVHLNLAVGADPAAAAPRTPADPRALARALEAIAGARRPVVVAGAAVARLVRDGRADLGALRVPVFTTAAAKGSIDEHLDAAAGVFTCAGAELAPERAVLPECDLVVALGLKTLEVLGAKPFAAPAIFIDDVIDWVDGFAPVHMVAVDDLAAAVSGVVSALSGASWGLDLVAAAHAALRAGMHSTEFLPTAAYACLGEAAARCNARLVTDSGNFTVVAEHVWRASKPTGYLGSSIGRFMGVALPQAIGAAIADRGCPVICTVGDGGLPAYLAEARIAGDHQLPILLVLMSDGFFGSMRAKVEERHLTAAGITVPPTNWLRLFEAIGWSVATASHLEAFAQAVSNWRGDTPMVIEARMPPGPYVSTVLPLRR